MPIPRPSSRLQYLAVAIGIIVVVGGVYMVGGSTSKEVAGDKETPNNWTPSNEPITHQTNTPSPPPDARDRLNSSNGTTAVQLSDGVTIIKGYQYEYTVSTASGLNGTLQFETRDTNPSGTVILGVKYGFTADGRTASDTAVGDSISTLLDDIDNGTARTAFAAALSLPYMNGTVITPSTTVGDTWDGVDGITAEAVGTDTIGGLDCLTVEFRKNGELLSEVCYSPEKQVVTKRVTYENGTELRRVTLSATR